MEALVTAVPLLFRQEEEEEVVGEYCQGWSEHALAHRPSDRSLPVSFLE